MNSTSRIWVRRRVALVMTVSSLMVATSTRMARAETSPRDSSIEASAEQGGAQVGAQLMPVVSASEICTRDHDAVGCETGRGFFALELQARFRLGEAMTLGPFATLGMDPGGRASVSGGADGESETSLRSAFAATGAELRLLTGASRSFWWGPRLGFFVVRDEVAVLGASGYDKSAQYLSALGPGIGIGYDLGVADEVELTFSLRADYVFFPGASTLPENGKAEWNSGPWFGLGIGLLFGV